MKKIIAILALLGITVVSTAYAAQVDTFGYLPRSGNQYLYKFIVCADKGEVLHNPSFKFQTDLGTTGPFEYETNVNSGQCKTLEANVKADNPNSINVMIVGQTATDELSQLRAENAELKLKLQNKDAIIQEQIKVIMNLIQKSSNGI